MNEIVKTAAKNILNILIFVIFAVFVVGFFVGLYFLDHYRWGGCK